MKIHKSVNMFFHKSLFFQKGQIILPIVNSKIIFVINFVPKFNKPALTGFKTAWGYLSREGGRGGK